MDHAKALAAFHHAAPSVEPCRLDAVLEDQGCCLGAYFGQNEQELCRLLGPSPPDFGSEHHQTCPSSLLLRDRDRWLVSLAGLACCSATMSWFAAVLHPCVKGTPKWCRWRIVPRATTSSRPRQLRISVHRAVDTFQIHVGPHSRPCFSAHVCRGLLQWEPAPTQHCTLLDECQKNRVGGHIGRCVKSREGAI